jgi:hypothetical protein
MRRRAHLNRPVSPPPASALDLHACAAMYTVPPVDGTPPLTPFSTRSHVSRIAFTMAVMTATPTHASEIANL